MKLLKIAVVSIWLLAGTSMAFAEFYKPGKEYLIIPRLNQVMHVKVIEVTPTEIVTVDRKTIKSTIRKLGDERSKGPGIAEYLKATPEQRKKLVDTYPTGDLPVAYSKGSLTGIEMPNNK